MIKVLPKYGHRIRKLPAAFLSLPLLGRGRQTTDTHTHTDTHNTLKAHRCPESFRPALRAQRGDPEIMNGPQINTENV